MKAFEILWEIFWIAITVYSIKVMLDLLNATKALTKAIKRHDSFQDEMRQIEQQRLNIAKQLFELNQRNKP